MKIYNQLNSFGKTPVCKIQNINKIVYRTLMSVIRGAASKALQNPMLPKPIGNSHTYKISSGRVTKPQQTTMPSTINDKPETIQSM